jgi:hypothetical protein
MNASKKCNKYQLYLVNNFNERLATISKDNIEVVSFLLAGAICFSEDKHNSKISQCELKLTVTNIFDLLVCNKNIQKNCKQLKIVNSAVERYRQLTDFQLGGQQTLTHLGVQQGGEVKTLPDHRCKGSKTEITSGALQMSNKDENIAISVSNIVNSLISLWRRK